MALRIDDLAAHRALIPQIAQWHFDLWRELTGFASFEEYSAHLHRCADGGAIPFVVIAFCDGKLAGSASVVVCDMPTRPDLTPWLAQVFVEPSARRQGIGAALVRAAAARCATLDVPVLYLFTSGELPAFYARLGWQTREPADYLGKPRTIMQLPLQA